MILALSTAEIWSLVIAALSSLLIPAVKRLIKYSKKIKKKKEEERQKQEKQDKIINELPLQLNQLRQEISEVRDSVAGNAVENKELKEEFNNFQILNIKYMINDAFFGYHNVHEIPYETLLVAAEGCDIYISKGKNHEIGARCEVIYAEFKRRELLKGEGVKHD